MQGRIAPCPPEVSLIEAVIVLIIWDFFYEEDLGCGVTDGVFDIGDSVEVTFGGFCADVVHMVADALDVGVT